MSGVFRLAVVLRSHDGEAHLQDHLTHDVSIWEVLFSQIQMSWGRRDVIAFSSLGSPKASLHQSFAEEKCYSDGRT